MSKDNKYNRPDELTQQYVKLMDGGMPDQQDLIAIQQLDDMKFYNHINQSWLLKRIYNKI